MIVPSLSCGTVLPKPINTCIIKGMVEIYDIMNITCQNLYHMPYQPSTYITHRAGGPWDDIGFSG